jgi:hypothetical protein
MSSPSHNAAVGYRVAVASLPVFTPDELSLLERAKTCRLTRAVRRLLERGHGPLGTWLGAATCQQCDWKLTFDTAAWDRFQFELNRMNRLNQLGCLWARLAFAKSDYSLAIETLVSLFASARHIGDGDLYFTRLCQWAFEARILDVTAEHFPSLNENVCNDLVDRLGRSPDPAVLRRSALTEKRFAEAQLGSPETSIVADFDRYIRMFCSPDEIDEIYRVVERDAHSIRVWLNRLLHYYELLAEMLTLPRRDFLVVLDEFKTTLRAENPMVIHMANVADRMHVAELRSRIKLAQFRAAVALGCGYEDVFNSIADPSTGRPFPFRHFLSGFELMSPPDRECDLPVLTRVGRESGIRPWFRRLLRRSETPYNTPP